MNPKTHNSFLSLISTLSISLLTAVLISGCRVPSPKVLKGGAFDWATYSNPKLGYSLEYPNVYAKSEERNGKDVIFRHNGMTAMRILFITESEGKDRGLWVKSKPVEEMEMGGRKGFRYVYNHQDFFSYVHTIACVLEYRGKLLGIEFRTDENMLDEVQQRILDSLRLDPESG